MSPEIERTGKSLATTRHQAIFRWDPRPLSIPAIDPNLHTLHPLVRTAEVLRFALHRLAFWLSPNGLLREWLRLNLLLAALVAITGLILAPLVTVLLGEIAMWVALILQIVTGIFSIACIAVAGFILLRLLESFKGQIHRARR